MLQAMLAGVASIKAQQTRMNVIGNNLANINTTAYKSSRVTFQDMIAQTVRGATRPTAGLGGMNPTQYGLGVNVNGTDVNTSQGSLSATNRPTDLAIQGSGFFMLGNGQAVSYSRDGGFDMDANGDIVSRSTGMRLLGWSANANGQIDTSTPITGASKLNVPIGLLNSVQATSAVQFGGNLDAAATSATTLTTQVTVYDSLGNSHDVSLTFSNHTVPPGGTPPPGATSSWDWQATEGTTVLGSSSGAGNQPIYFDANGSMVNAAGMFNISIPGQNGATALPISMDLSKISNLNTTAQVNAIGQNGFPPGSLANFSIGSDGTVTGVFSNGLTRALGQVAMAVFPNEGGLERAGNNMWTDSDNSGLPVVGTPATSGRGALSVGFLEQSNVDIGNEFSDLIITQRGFQANTRVVTTVDEMMQDLINMKR